MNSVFIIADDPANRSDVASFMLMHMKVVNASTPRSKPFMSWDILPEALFAQLRTFADNRAFHGSLRSSPIPRRYTP
jgi:hypothetical protein